ncbi:hypothetical protein ACH4TI_15200 [Streptomyces rochei]|uniref:hypothetical protein n=1 Tax=Streptomyces rochei TaxID=1928 RepID=UPI00379BACE9
MTTAAAAVTTLAFVLGLPAAWCHGYRTQRQVAERRAAARAERAARPADERASLEDGVVAVALAAACCERWWTSAGAEHDGPCTSRWATSVACCPECAVEPGTPCHQNGQPLDHAHDRRIQEAKETTA